ncbi:MAG: hypothetical protein U9P72_01515 [Campylobacterota bacterium]|nr:hypothetical protein [Campylobacterota bacterium]
MTTFNNEVFNALIDVFIFWFPIAWSFTILLALFRALKYIFNSCYDGYRLNLLTCKKESIDIIGYGDLVKVWRRYFMLLIWIIAVFILFSVTLTYLFSSYESVFDWFNIYILYAYILISSYFTFIILISKCKLIKVNRC